MLDEMRVISEPSDRAYGSLRLYRALVGLGYAVSHRRVERLMRHAQWRARVVRVYRRTTGRYRWCAQHPNRVRAQATTGPNQIWVGDVTSVSVAGRWWYVADILDGHSRPLLAWRLGAARDGRFTGHLPTRLARYARYCNQERLHSSLGHQSTVDYERGAA